MTQDKFNAEPSLRGMTTLETWVAMLCSKTPDVPLRRLQALGHLKEAYPELEALVGFGGGEQGHKDLWEHTLKVVTQVVPKPELRFAALWHDVGKVEAFSRETGKVSFHKHEYISARLFRDAMKRTKLLQGEFLEKVHFLIYHLGLVESYEPEWTDSAVRRLTKELGPHFHDVCLLSRADVTTRHAHKREAIHRRIHELEERAKAVAAADAVVPPLPSGVGEAIMQAFKLKPSKLVGDLKKVLEQAILDGEIEPHKDDLYYVEYLRARRGNFNL